jgi:hypothetical protein
MNGMAMGLPLFLVISEFFMESFEVIAFGMSPVTGSDSYEHLH